MRISFDLDDTLICHDPAVPCEPQLPWHWRLFAGRDPLRSGARALIRELGHRGWEIWIYTTSFRKPAAVKRWLWCHGAPVATVINQTIHDARLRRSAYDHPPTKNPAAFGITLHVDDSRGVRIEGEAHGFQVIVISPDDTNWVQKVLVAADSVASNMGTGGKY